MPIADDEPEAAWDGNLTATRRLYEAVARWGGRPRILSIGSGLTSRSWYWREAASSACSPVDKGRSVRYCQAGTEERKILVSFR